MRKHKTSKIDDKEFSIKELRVQDLLDILNGIGDAGGIEEEIAKWLPRCTDLTLEDLRQMAPSELMQIYETFREVNADFFEIAGRLGLNKMAARMKESFMNEFSGVLSDSLKRVIPESGNTDIQHSV